MLAHLDAEFFFSDEHQGSGVAIALAHLDGALHGRVCAARTAYGAINSVQDLIGHPQLRTHTMTVNGQSVQVPAAPYRMEWDEPEFRGAPQIGQHRVLPAAVEPGANEG